MIGELEDAIIARIQSALSAGLLPYKLPTVETYGGQIAEDTQSTFRFPAVFVSFVRSKTRKIGNRGRIMRVELNLYVAARNPRNERATRHGDMHEPGSYQIIEDMIALLENQSLGMLMAEPLWANGIDTLFVARRNDGAKAESILVTSLHCEFGWEAAMPDCANVSMDDWLSTGQRFYLVPDDDTPDAGADIIHAT